MARVEYHEPEIATGKATGKDGKKFSTFQAKCVCGWFGPNRSRPMDADDDAMEHRIAENPR